MFMIARVWQTSFLLVMLGPGLSEQQVFAIIAINRYYYGGLYALRILANLL